MSSNHSPERLAALKASMHRLAAMGLIQLDDERGNNFLVKMGPVVDEAMDNAPTAWHGYLALRHLADCLTQEDRHTFLAVCANYLEKSGFLNKMGYEAVYDN